MTDDVFLGLTDEEAEALRDDEVETITEEVLEETDDEELSDAPADAADEPEESADPAAEESPSQEIKVEQSPFAPEYRVQKVENYEALVADADTKYQTSSDALAAKYAAGEIDFAQHQSESRALQTEYNKYIRELDAAKLKADIAEEYTRQAQAQRWELEQQMFLTDNPDFKTDPVLRGALAGVLDTLYADEANQGKSGIWFLREAGRLVNERFAPKAPDNVVEMAPKADAKLDAAKAAQAKKAIKTPPVPKTLAEVPLTSPNDDGGEFSHLDGLDGEMLEKAISKLTPDAYERWLAAA